MTATGASICLVEDDAIMGESLSERLSLEGYSVSWCRNGTEALTILRSRDFDALVCDVRLPGMSGDQVFRALLKSPGHSPPPTLFITGYGTIDHAVELLKLGALDYITKPLDIQRFLEKLEGICQHRGTQTGVGSERLGVSAAMRALQGKLPVLAAHKGTPVLVTGESGTGKEVLARALHDTAPEPGPFIPVNCAAIPETLIESELFGHAKGAFTGASAARAGLFEQAHGGSLFLDEIGDMPLDMQARLLRVIQERTIVRVGSNKPVKVDIRLICATHRDLRRLVRCGDFREDLYYRINVVRLHITPLRERREDLLWLAERFLAGHAARFPGEDRKLGADARELLLRHPWPGNARELMHALERACIMGEGPMIHAHDLDLEPESVAVTQGDETALQGYLGVQERLRIIDVLRDHDWVIQEAARFLGISRKTLWLKMKKYGISKPD